MMVTVDILILLNIPMIIFLGIITSYQDFKHNKIKNKWIKFALIYSIISLIVSILLLKYRNEPINLIYIKVFFSNIIISLAVGILLWLSHLWSAGDAKLFLAYTALVPLSMYKWGGNNFFPAYIILINTFTPIFLYFLIKLIFNLKIKLLIKEIKEIINFNQIITIALYLFGMSWITQKIFQLFDITTNRIFNLIFLVIIYGSLRKSLKEKFWILTIICSISRIIFDLISFNTVLTVLKQILIFLGIKLLINLGHYTFSKQIYIEDLKPEMSLAENIIKVKTKYMRKKDTIYFPTQILLKQKSKGSIFPDYRNLNEKDIKKINKLHSEGKFESHVVYIRENMPFAVILFAGIILTLIFRGNFLIHLFELFN